MPSKPQPTLSFSNLEKVATQLDEFARMIRHDVKQLRTDLRDNPQAAVIEQLLVLKLTKEMSQFTEILQYIAIGLDEPQTLEETKRVADALQGCSLKDLLAQMEQEGHLQ